MSKRQWLNPLIAMGATIIMCLLLAISQTAKPSLFCISKIMLHINVNSPHDESAWKCPKSPIIEIKQTNFIGPST